VVWQPELLEFCIRSKIGDLLSLTLDRRVFEKDVSRDGKVYMKKQTHQLDTPPPFISLVSELPRDHCIGTRSEPGAPKGGEHVAAGILK